jgi:starvation-inducible DNA-binding protein
MDLLGVRATNAAAWLSSTTGHIRRGMAGLQRRNGIPPHNADIEMGDRRMTNTAFATNQLNNRRRVDDVEGFRVSPEFADNLQWVLVDLIELQLQGKQAHWNVVGTNFRDLHLQLDELVDFAREAGDTIAERMRALEATPDGRSDTVAATTTVPQIPAYEHNSGEVVDLITTRIYATVDTIRTVHDSVDEEDPSTADILHQLIAGLEKLAWLIKSENRKV